MDREAWCAAIHGVAQACPYLPLYCGSVSIMSGRLSFKGMFICPPKPGSNATSPGEPLLLLYNQHDLSFLLILLAGQ